MEGPPTALFPLSRRELGDVWLGAAISVWEVQPIAGGWRVAEDEFAMLVGYPFELLQLLLSTLRNQRYPDGTSIRFDTWLLACRQPLDKLYVRYLCITCHMPRRFSARVFLDGAVRGPTFACADIHAVCRQPHPEVI